MTKKTIRDKKINKIRKWKRRSFVILSIFIFLIVFIFVMIFTSLGVKLTTVVLDKFLPELKIAQVEGSFHNLHIKGLSLELPGVDIQVNEAFLELSSACLMQTKICIKYFGANGVTVNIITSKTNTDPNKPESKNQIVLNTPLPIELYNTHVTNVKANINDMTFSMSDFVGKATWINHKIYVYPTVAQDLTAIFADEPQSSVNQEIKNTVPFNEKINQWFNKPIIKALPQVHIPIDINVSRLSGDNWLLHIGGQDYWFNQASIQTDIINNYILVKRVETYFKTPHANGHALVSGDITLGDCWPITASVIVNTENNQLSGKITGKLLGEIATNIAVEGLNKAKIEGNINFIKNYMPVMASISGKHIQWPIEGNAQYQLNNFDLSLNGNVQKYKLAMIGTTKANNIPNATFDIVGNGTYQGISFVHGMIQLPQGQVNASGNIDWGKALKWDSKIKLTNVDISKEVPNFPIRLNGQFKTTGILEGNHWQLSLSELQLKGDIKQADFLANGSLQIDSKHSITTNNLAIAWGNNQINVNGSTDKGNLNGKISLESLSLFINGMKGRIIGNVKINGTINDQTMDTNLTVSDLNLHEFTVESANLSGKLQYQKQISGQLKLIGQGIKFENESVKKANIELSGNEDHHNLSVDIEGSPASIITSLTGQITKDRTKWSGNISHILLSLGNKNHWQLAKTLPLSFDFISHMPTIGAHCWLNNSSSICLDKPLSLAPNTDTSVTLKNIDLAKLPIPNDSETKLVGSIDGKADIKFTTLNKIPSIKANITGTKVYIQQIIVSETLTIPFDLFKLNVELNEQITKLNWDFSLNQLGKITGALSITDPTHQKKLRGQLVVDHLALAIINPLLDKNDYANGFIDGIIKFSGSLMDPYLNGVINLRHSEIKARQLPVDVKTAILDINFNGKSSTLKGVLTTQSGDVNINGQANWNTFDKWQAELTINGAAMEVTVPPMVVMSIIPDLRINATQDELTLLGRVSIPKGKITVESLPTSSVDISSDEVMLDENYKVIEKQKIGMKINSHIEIDIGDKVTVDAFGLNAALKGNLIATQTNKGLDLHGQVLIPTGRFHAYGQDLVIRKGIITFSGPTDQARLDIEAIRNPESIDNNNITAGIKVIGTSEDPKIEIFSDPAMSQQEALSYLIRGEGLDNTDQSENDMMTSLLVGIGTAKTGKYIGDIGNVFGIKNLTLDTQGAGNNSKVVVSGYILPNLQLKYGVGIFDSLATFTLRYRLIPSLYLEATSGIAQTLDLIYQFEF